MTELSPASLTTTPEHIRVIGFDWDGTVVNSVPPKLLQNQALAREFGRDLTIEEVRCEWNASSGFPDLMQRLTGSGDMERIMKVVKRDYNNPDFAKQRFEFAIPAINRVHALGLRTALITNLTSEMLAKDADDLAFELEKYFDLIQPVDACEHKKPDGRVFVPVFVKLGIEAAQLAYVGDEQKDRIAIQEIGGTFIGVTTGMTSREEFMSIGCEPLNSIDDLTR